MDLKKEIARLNIRIESLELLVLNQAKLIDELSIALHKATSNNSSLPPSKDENRPKKNQSLRKKTGKKQGGQKGHKGSTLKMNSSPDIIVDDSPEYCIRCGLKLGEIEELTQKRQVIDIEPAKVKVTEYRSFSKVCSCGHCTSGSFPSFAMAPISYGRNIEVLISYMSVRQYMSISRIREYLSQVYHVNMSEGTVVNKLEKFAYNCRPIYQEIKNRVERSSVVGADETGYKLNGKKAWMWIWQTPNLSYIVASTYRGYKTIKETFEKGLPLATLVHDCWMPYFKMQVKHHQICIAHLLRELNYFIELRKDNWSYDFKRLLLKALKVKREIYDLPQNEFTKRISQIKQSAKILIFQSEINSDVKKLRAFHKRMKKYFDYLFTFLDDTNVPPDNNASERGIRNVKVKLKISGQFNAISGAFQFACIRSVIDTAIKNNANIFDVLSIIPSSQPE